MWGAQQQMKHLFLATTGSSCWLLGTLWAVASKVVPLRLAAPCWSVALAETGEVGTLVLQSAAPLVSRFGSCGRCASSLVLLLSFCLDAETSFR